MIFYEALIWVPGIHGKPKFNQDYYVGFVANDG